MQHLKNKNLRIAFGLSLIAFSLYVISPYFVNFRTQNAVINANVHHVKSSVPGILQYRNLDETTSFVKDEKIFSVYNQNQDRSFLYELNTLEKTLIAKINAVKNQKNGFIEQKKYLAERELVYKNLIKEKISQNIELSKIRIGNLEKEIDLKNNPAFLRNRTLNDQDYILQLENRLRIEKKTLESMLLDLRAAKKGIFIEIGRSETSLSKQEQLFLQERIAELNSLIVEEEEKLKNITNQINEELRRVNNTISYHHIVNFNGIVWRKHAAENEFVFENNEILSLLNCDRLFVDAVISNRQASRISIGDDVAIRRVGEFQEFSGEVQTIFGAGVKYENNREVAVFSEKEYNESIVRILINNDFYNEININPNNQHCFVGTTVEVKFRKVLDLNVIQKIREWSMSVY